MKISFYGKVEEKGKVIWNNPVIVGMQLAMLGGEEVRIDICTELKSISVPQRKYYFGHLVKELAEAFGWTREEMHDWLKAKFASRVEMITINGRVREIRRIPSVMDLSTVEAEEFYAKIRNFGSEEGIPLWLPNEWEEKYKQLVIKTTTDV